MPGHLGARPPQKSLRLRPVLLREEQLGSRSLQGSLELQEGPQIPRSRQLRRRSRLQRHRGLQWSLRPGSLPLRENPCLHWVLPLQMSLQLQKMMWLWRTPLSRWRHLPPCIEPQLECLQLRDRPRPRKHRSLQNQLVLKSFQIERPLHGPLQLLHARRRALWIALLPIES